MKTFLAILILIASALCSPAQVQAQTNAAVSTTMGLGPYGGIFGGTGKGIFYGDRNTSYGVSDPYFTRNDSSFATQIGISNSTYYKVDTNGFTYSYGGNSWTTTTRGSGYLDSISYINNTSATPRFSVNRGTNIIDTIGGAHNTADTIVMPSSPRNQDVVILSFNGQYAAGVFITGGIPLNNPVTSGNGGTVLAYIYNSRQNAWYKWSGNK